MPELRLLASYPKSGNTWMRAFLASLEAGGKTPDINRDLGHSGTLAGRIEADRALDEDTADLPIAEAARARPWITRRLAAQPGGPRVVKVHDANLPAPGADEPAFPAETIDRVLYVVRDPRDIALSGGHHFGIGPERMTEWLADAQRVIGASRSEFKPQLPQLLSSWSCHVESWLDAPGLRLLCVRYEDLLADPAHFVTVARFFGHDGSEDEIARAADAVSHARLAAQERAAGFCERPADGTAPFFRAGRAGGWREALAPALARSIERDHGAVMRRLGYL